MIQATARQATAPRDASRPDASSQHAKSRETTPRIAVVIASLGRPENIAALLDRLAHQTLRPSQVILSMETAADAPAPRDTPFPLERVFGPRGMTVQRNRGLDLLAPDIEVVVFYDDDFVPSRHALAGMAAFFARYPDVAGAHGLVIEDGVTGPGIAPGQARAIMDEADTAGPLDGFTIMREVPGLYGCNMAYRTASIQGIRFDEGLPLYAWLEDLDFGGRIAGRLVHTDAFQGVHCGEKRGREKNGQRLGYSQICNPVYMARKGSISLSVAARQIVRNVLANHVRIFSPEPWVDRRGRVTGNWIAFGDLLRGRADPRRILEL